MKSAPTPVSLRDLERRLAEASGADREIDLDLMVLAHGGPRERYLTDELERLEFGWQSKFTHSLDAAVSLVERVRPALSPCVGQNVHHKHWHARLSSVADDGDVCTHGEADAPTPALALCLALVRAVIAESDIAAQR